MKDHKLLEKAINCYENIAQVMKRTETDIRTSSHKRSGRGRGSDPVTTSYRSLVPSLRFIVIILQNLLIFFTVCMKRT